MSNAQPHAGVEVSFRGARDPTHPAARYPGLRPEEKLLRAGTVTKPGSRALACDIKLSQDVGVKLRDGKCIYVDILRPVGDTPVPAILSWGPYGKQGGVIVLDDIPGRAGIPGALLSGLEMFEGPDPSYWCSHGYAVVNADARGAFSSEGDVHFWGRQDGMDGHDLIEWLARQSWCNGKVGMSGNSWLAISQWFIAAEQPPHLAAIAPWEGWTDLFRCDVVRGGIPDIGFNEHMSSLFAGHGRVEDVPRMVRRYPLMNAYWEDKIPCLENIEIPAYVVGSWTNLIHGIGTLAGFRQIASVDKWLRVHNSHEWTDYYRNADDLRRFFDCYLKGIESGWRLTPRVRLAVLDPGGRDVIDRGESEFPLARTQHRSLYLNATTAQLQTEPSPQEANASYRSADSKDRLSFTYRFPEDTELTGYFALRLWVEAHEADDMDIYVEVRKLGRFGRLGLSRNIIPPNPLIAWVLEQLYRLGKAKFGMMFFSGAKGMHRVSQRQTDPDKSTAAEPFHTFVVPKKLEAGERVPVDIQIWPMGMKWRAGEQLQLLIAGHKLSTVEMPGLVPPDTVNQGRHIIHTGGRYDSRLIVPFVPVRSAQ
ncbi:MAG TPA: CocE/NonD family hydrolase [Steroidobacteraceae bacterium]|nr:CocE/NonD family hydrolase [Steroidobacteraceae bacterium]